MIHLLLTAAVLIVLLSLWKKENAARYLLAAMALLFLVGALRDGYGNDFEPYRKIFVNAHKGINSARVELGFFFLNRIFPSFHLLLATLTFVYTFVAYKLVRDNVVPKYYWCSVLLLVINPYLYLMSLSSLRQTLAMCIFVLALQLPIQKKWLRFVVFAAILLLTTQIHQTVWLLIPLYFYFHLKKTPFVEKVERIFFFALPIILIGFEGLFEQIIELVLHFFQNNWNYKYYINTSTPNSVRSTILNAIFYLYVLGNMHRLKGKPYQYARMYLCGLLFAILSYRYNMFGRFQMYFDLMGTVALPMMVYECRKQPRGKVDYWVNGLAYPLLLLAIFVLRYYSFFTNPMWEYFFTYDTFLT